ncbi:MAG: modification methylase [Thermoproteota archaeon]|nr:MAG: modification methylase [Candidatus Korarchaeota archaeon]
MEQKTFDFYETEQNFYETKDISDVSFSHGDISSEVERQKLEKEYATILVETEKFSRKLVSYQGNKTEVLHSWIKYREGFSANLVEMLLNEFEIKPKQKILDPFAGSCTTLLVAKMLGIDSVGIELLPHCHLAWEMKSNVDKYDLGEIDKLILDIKNNDKPETNHSFGHLQITESAFPEKNEKDLMAYLQLENRFNGNKELKTLYKATLMNILEDISYTRKDGQYLRWDRRAEKIINRNKIRASQGKKTIKGIDKGEIPNVQELLIKNLQKIRKDVKKLQKNNFAKSTHKLLEGNTLHILPTLADNQFDIVITSPPYANRYDYTRTYALELAYLGVGEEIFNYRQEMLSCTVENKAKYLQLEKTYVSLERHSDYKKVIEILDSTKVLKEVINALNLRNKRGEINNKSVITMIEQYFGELSFVFFELYRTSKKGARIVFINDNVRYAGEVIPVDLISTKIAEKIGFIPEKVYVLPQRKGNSSQQMKKFGRRELRKSITVWRKD